MNSTKNCISNIYFNEININLFMDDQLKNYMKTDLIAIYVDDVFCYYNGKVKLQKTQNKYFY